MKRILLIFASLFYVTVVSAQNEVDALRYAYLDPVGTARYSALGGATGALGGDLTNMAFNPAGIGVYRSGSFAFTPTWYTAKTNSAYYAETNSATRNNFQLSNIGFVTSADFGGKNGFEYVNFGFAYNQLANYTRDIFVSGMNSFGSFLDDETVYVNDYGPDGNLYVNTDVIYYDDASGEYINDYMLAPGNGGYQQKSIRSKGYAGQYDFSLAANYDNKLYVGGSIGILHVKYEESAFYSETPHESVPNLLYFENDDFFRTKGNGVNFKFGIIGRVNDYIRLGAGIHTPTFFSMRDTYNSKVLGRIDYVDGPSDNTSSSGNNFFEWELMTPFKALGSAAFIYKNFGFVSFDYEYIDYSAMNMQAIDYSFTEENQQITKLYGVAHNFKVGAEFNMGPLALRGGYSIYGSPFHKDSENSNASRAVLSGGLGFRSELMFVDFTVKHAQRDEYYYIYGSTDSKASLENQQMSYITTIGFKF